VGANPVDRGKPGSKLHLVCEGGGLPLTAAVTAANGGDTTMFQPVLQDIPPIRTPARRRRTRPEAVHADKGYDSAANRAWLRQRGIRPRIARRGVESSARLGRHRWKVERALSWLSCWRRLQVRWDRDSGRFFAFVLVACALTCFHRLWGQAGTMTGAVGPPAELEAGCDGRSTTASSSTESVSRSSSWRRRR
jgi:IS5 family transposase